MVGGRLPGLACPALDSTPRMTICELNAGSVVTAAAAAADNNKKRSKVIPT